MRVRGVVVPAVTIALALGSVGLAGADNEPFPGSKPVLKPGSMWVETDWGYKLATLDLNKPPSPTHMTTEGYGGAGRPNAYLRMPDGELMALNISFGDGPRGDYARVKASVRGTECSGGSYNLYDRVHAADGKVIIEWIAGQSWSNGAVGLHGSSLSGQTAYWIATMHPRGLKAISANLLHSDIYRDIFMVGGVQNYLFPSIWTYVSGPHRIPRDRMQDQWFFNDEICQFNQTTKYGAGDPPQVENEPAWAAIRSVDDDWYAAHAALTYADTITIPYYQQANWQDEQVGPRGLILWKHIHPDPVTVACKDAIGTTKTFAEPKKLTVSSGDHGWGEFHNRDLWKFFDLFLLDKCGASAVLDHRVESFFETRGNDPDEDFTARAYGDDWPLPGTRWPKTYLHELHGMNTQVPGGDEPGDTYLSGVAKQNWFYETPDELMPAHGETFNTRSYPDSSWFLSEPVGSPDMPATTDGGNFIVSGPILMNLWASLGGVDTDFFVSVSDVFPADHPTNPNYVSYVQRGWLKASHRTIDPGRSYYAKDPDHGNVEILVQPYMTHTNPQPVLPRDPTEFQIEIFPLGHIFRPGHRIMIQIHTPPSVDGLWGYTPTHHPPAAVTILHDAAHKSWIQWPQISLPSDQPVPDDFQGVHYPGALGVANPPAGCKIPGGFPCWAPSRLDLALPPG
jgi:hypothetical protein